MALIFNSNKFNHLVVGSRGAKLFVIICLTAYFTGCTEHKLDASELVKTQPIAVSYSTLKKPFDTKALKNFIESKNYDVKKKNNVIFIMIDALRRDYITEDLAPNLYKFLHENHELKGVSSSTITHFSTYSIFYGMSPNLRDYVLIDEWDIGSPFLNILKNVGYDLSVFGSPWQYCIDDNKLYNSPKELQQSAESNLELLYGLKTKNLLNFCYEHGQGPGKPQVFPKVPVTQKNDEGVLFGHQAYLDQAVVSDFLEAIKDQKEKNFYLLYLFSVHLPYAWPDRGPLANKMPKVLSPNIPWEPGESAFKKKHKESAVNSYKNALIWIDYLFKETIDGLKKEDKYDDALIVLFSDHGEFLYDKTEYSDTSDVVGHCCTPYFENTNIALAYKFPKDSLVEIKRGKDNLGTHIDIVPTVLDFLGFSDMDGLKKFIDGSSILQTPRECVLSFSPAGKKGPRVFSILVNGTRYYLKLDRNNAITSKGFFMDREIHDGKIYYFNKDNAQSVKDAEEILNNKHFKGCLNEIFIKPRNNPTIRM